MGEMKIKQEGTQVKGPCLFGFPQKANTWVQIVIWKETPKLTNDEVGKVRREGTSQQWTHQWLPRNCGSTLLADTLSNKAETALEVSHQRWKESRTFSHKIQYSIDGNFSQVLSPPSWSPLLGCSWLSGLSGHQSAKQNPLADSCKVQGIIHHCTEIKWAEGIQFRVSQSSSYYSLSNEHPDLG